MEQDIEEIRAELKKLTKLSQDNNVMLRSIQHRARMALLWSFFRWAIVIALAVGSFYYIQPYLVQLAAVYQKVTGSQLDFMQFIKKF